MTYNSDQGGKRELNQYAPYTKLTINSSGVLVPGYLRKYIAGLSPEQEFKFSVHSPCVKDKPETYQEWYDIQLIKPYYD
ncbi:MAG: hypothetical protein IPP32_05385 [Bacteroidetes bacterium]|nr:hypothetical protein [Bacteroidota bacterium]